jgi:hypothetical protein
MTETNCGQGTAQASNPNIERTHQANPFMFLSHKKRDLPQGKSRSFVA